MTGLRLVVATVLLALGALPRLAVAQDVAAMGGRLRAAIDARDWTAAAVANEQVRTWLTTMAGVVTSRLTHSFSEPAG